ncbi:MAG: 2-oxoacid:acceptor oxidoreductase family protein [Anaerolineae bacterium]|nr:2-oxoacid:acceptor oxidoreductase family protein [Anaerolineae bacterium]
MQTEIVFAGFGGQGVLFAGQLLTYTAMNEGMHVTWIPSYGPEMRGGTANCTVVVSDQSIGSPVVRNPGIAVVFNLPSLDKYESLVKPGGLLVVNSALIARAVARRDVTALLVPANAVADELGSPRLLNMVMLGALLAKRPIVTLEAVEHTLDATLSGSKRALLEMNVQALHRGHAIGAGEAVPRLSRPARAT